RRAARVDARPGRRAEFADISGYTTAGVRPFLVARWPPHRGLGWDRRRDPRARSTNWRHDDPAVANGGGGHLVARWEADVVQRPERGGRAALYRDFHRRLSDQTSGAGARRCTDHAAGRLQLAGLVARRSVGGGGVEDAEQRHGQRTMDYAPGRQSGPPGRPRAAIHLRCVSLGPVERVAHLSTI